MNKLDETNLRAGVIRLLRKLNVDYSEACNALYRVQTAINKLGPVDWESMRQLDESTAPYSHGELFPGDNANEKPDWWQGFKYNDIKTRLDFVESSFNGRFDWLIERVTALEQQSKQIDTQS